LVCILLIIILAGIILGLIHHYNVCRYNGRIIVTFFINGIKIKGNTTMVSMSYSQKVTVEIQAVDSNGNPAQVEAGSINVSSSNPEVCSIVRDAENENRFDIYGSNNGTVGVAQIDISADADLGEGVSTITGFIGVEITPKQAVGLGITIGEPVEQ